MNNKVLCVDDDANILTGIQRNLRKQFEIDTAVGALAALKMIEQECPYAVIVADMQMPGMNGVEFLNITKQKYPDTVRVMLTGNADQKTATEAVNRGHIFQFLNKPCPPDKLGHVLTDAIKHHRLVTAERELLENTLNGSVKVLMEILSLTDPVSFGRGQMLRDQARKLGEFLKIQPTWTLELAAMLSAIGSVSVPPTLAMKVRSGLTLTGDEKDILRRVPQVGSDLISRIPRLETVAQIILYQDKQFDGGGFPADSVKGDEIPVESRIIKVLHDLAALKSPKQSDAEAFAIMRKREGCYDTAILDAVAACFDLSPHVVETPRQTVAINPTELRVGHVLMSDVRTSDDVLIIGSGATISPLMLERLRNFASLSGLKSPVHVLAT